MADDLDFLLTYAGVPFVLDDGEAVRARLDRPHEPYREDALRAPRLHQPEAGLYDELLRVTNLRYLQDYALPGYPGRKLGGLAHQPALGPHPAPEEMEVGDWYYPTGARRWSVFRGLATSAMVKDMVRLTGGGAEAKPLTVRAVPDGAGAGRAALFTVTSYMHMLPARPLGEDAGADSLDGLFLVTLVDERYYWQHRPLTLHVDHTSTWSGLFSQIASALGVAVTVDAVPDAAGRPDPDSPLWANSESAAALFDAVALNVGCTVVRALDGTYRAMTSESSRALVAANRALLGRLVRAAGGDLFAPAGRLPAGSLAAARNAVVPATVRVSFPRYVVADPVPHYQNSRHTNQRPTSWHEESYGEEYAVDVPILSGGSAVSGLTGMGTHCVHDTAKALFSGEADATPYNLSGLTALAMFVAQDHYDTQAAVAVDEVYPGTLKWTPTGVHDLVWTYSARKRLAVTRVIRPKWNNHPAEMQHAATPVSGQTTSPAGAGGRSVAQTWRDQYSGAVSTQLADALASGAYAASLRGVGNLPTQNRWRGRVNGETVLFEGTSGSSTVGVARRGVDGTVQAAHASGDTVTLVTPGTAYGVNLVTFEKGQYVFPAEATSGGVHGVRVVPQTQTVQVLNNVPATIGGVAYYSGQVLVYDTAAGSPQYAGREYVWVLDRNDAVPRTSVRYDGQFVGYSASGAAVAPVYAVSEVSGGVAGGDTLTSGSVQWFYLASGAVRSGHLTSGAVQSGTLDWTVFAGCLSGVLCSGSVDWFHLTSGAGVWMLTSGHTVITVSGYPGFLISGIYNSVSGYPYPIVSGIYIVVSGYPYPIVSGVRVVVSGCFPYPVCSGDWVMISGYPYPTYSGQVTVSGYAVPTYSGAKMISGFPVPIQVEDALKFVVVSGFITPAASGSKMVSGFPVPLVSGTYVYLSGFPYPVYDGWNFGASSGSIQSGHIASGAVGCDQIACTSVAKWQKVTLAYGAFTSVNRGAEVGVYTLPAKGAVHHAVVQHTTRFSGTGPLTTLLMSMGISGAPEGYVAQIELASTPGTSNFVQYNQQGVGAISPVPTMGGPTTILAYASGDVNLNQLTGGSVDFYLYVSTLP